MAAVVVVGVMEMALLVTQAQAVPAAAVPERAM